jgi:hypothetical protein
LFGLVRLVADRVSRSGAGTGTVLYGADGDRRIRRGGLARQLEVKGACVPLGAGQYPTVTSHHQR